MKTKLRILLATIALVSASSVWANDRGSFQTKLDSSSGSGVFSLNVDPITGTFDEYLHIDSGDKKSISTEIDGSSNLTWEALSVSYGDKVYNSFSNVGGDDKKKSGSISDSDTGYFTLHLKGHVNQDEHGSYDVHVTAVPEPETYAMLLAGLGLVGAVARRRKSTSDSSKA
jgi:hypothetical protein